MRVVERDHSNVSRWKKGAQTGGCLVVVFGASMVVVVESLFAAPPLHSSLQNVPVKKGRRL